MSTPKAKLRRTQKRKVTVVATPAALDDTRSSAASRSSNGTAQDATSPSNRNVAVHVNEKRAPKAGTGTNDQIVLDNLPVVIPVNRRELEIIETFLGNLIDGLLLEAASDSAVTSLSIHNPGRLIRVSRPRV